MTPQERSPISFSVNVARLPKNGMPVRFEANDVQRLEMAKAHDLLEVRRLVVEVDIIGWKKGGVKVTGDVSGEIVQACAVTLEPVEETVEEPISAVYLPAGSRLAKPYNIVEGEIILDPEGEDLPETFTGDEIDIGAIAEEFFTLGINPYPRKAGVEVAVKNEGDDEERGPLFEKLAALRNKL